MSKETEKADKIMADKDDSDELPLEPEPPPERVSSSDVPASLPAPRAARFGEGIFYSHAEALRSCAEFQRFLQHPDDAPFFPTTSTSADARLSALPLSDDNGSLPVSALRNCL